MLCCKTEKIEAQRGQTSCWRLHSGSVPSRGYAWACWVPRAACFPLLGSGLKWICSWQHKSSLALLGPCQQGGWLVPCMTSSFMSLSASPTPNSEPKPESGAYPPPPLFLLSPDVPVWHHLTVTMYEAGLQVSSLGPEAQRQHQTHLKPHSRLAFEAGVPKLLPAFSKG